MDIFNKSLLWAAEAAFFKKCLYSKHTKKMQNICSDTLIWWKNRSGEVVLKLIIKFTCQQIKKQQKSFQFSLIFHNIFWIYFEVFFIFQKCKKKTLMSVTTIKYFQNLISPVKIEKKLNLLKFRYKKNEFKFR